MTAEDIFLASLEKRTPGERKAYLDGACGNDVALRAQVEALLRSHQEAGSFLESPLFESPVTIDQPVGERAETQIGPYKLIERIGEGGMGTVWMAQQSEPVKRLVAVKLIKAGMDSRQVIARFEAERQALAIMDHANIARVLDAGATSAGRPYFVMDLVRGVPITKYCDDHHLTPRQRLELFIPVCQAVQHAHQKGIIHRDLKPSNVLVALYDGQPVPKVIDFGVAKATGQTLTEKTLVTGFGLIVGTPEYMSPEQAEINQLDIDTRSDIYSLGVLLYELLTGSPPFSRQELEKAGMLEMLRVIREQEPTKPSTKLSTAEGLPTLAANRGTEPAKLTRLVRGELDWIVMKALEKDRNRRYETANMFAADVERYLHDEPVQACPPSSWYRMRKFARRNKAALTTAAVIASALVLGITVSTWQAFRATKAENLAKLRLENEKRATAKEAAARLDADQQRQKALENFTEAQSQRRIAEENFAKARAAVDDYFVQVSDSTLLKAAGMQPLRRELLEAALRFYEELTKQRSNDLGLQTELADAHLRIGRIHSELGSRDEAQKAFGRAQELYEILLKSRPDEVDLQHGVARCQFWRGKSLEAIESWEKLVERASVRVEIRRELSGAYNTVALDNRNAGKTAEALQWHRKALAIREQLAAADPDNLDGRYALGETLNNIAVLLSPRDADSLALYRRALEHGTFAFDRAPQIVGYGRLVATSHGNIAGCESRLGSPQAVESYQRAIGVWKRLALDNPAVSYLHANLANIYRDLAFYQRDLGRADEWTQTMRLRQQVLERFPQQSATDLYNFACLHAISSVLVAKDPLTASAQELLESQKEVESEAKEAVAALDQAIKAGFTELTLLQIDKDLDSLRSREDFQKLLANLDETLKTNQIAQAEKDGGAKLEALVKAAAVGGSPESLEAGQTLLAIRQGLAEAAPERLDRRADVAATQHAIGLIQLSLGQLEEAGRSLVQAETTRQQLVTAKPENLAYQADVAATGLALGDWEWKSNRLTEGAARWKQALALLAEIVRAEPDNNRIVSQFAAAEAAVGNSYGEIGLWREAADHFAQAFAAQPSGNSYSWVTVGYLSLWAGDHESYRRVCMQALERAKGDIDRRLLSDLTACINLSPEPLIDSAKLVEMAQQVLAIEPTAGWRRFRVALAQYRAGLYAEALRSLEGYGDARAVAAMSYHRLGQRQRAREELAKTDRQTDKVLQEALRAESLRIPYYSWSSWVMDQMLRREAHELIDGKPLAADPREHLLLARAYSKLGQQDKSNAALQAAADSAASDPQALLALLQVLDQLGRHDEAEAVLQRASELYPGNSRPWIARARFFAQHGQRERAEALFSKAATIAPDELHHFLEAGWWAAAEAGEGPLAPADAGAPRTWHHVPTADWGRIDFRSVPEVKALPVAQAVNYVYSPDLRSVTLLIGSAERVRLELNGELVYDGTGRAWEWGLVRVPALLRPGRNTFVATVVKPDNWHAFTLRITDSPFDRGYLLAQLGLWDEALALWTPELDAQLPNQAWIWYHYAAMLLNQGQSEAYRRVCSQMLQRPGIDNWERNRVPAACALAPLDEAEAARLVKLIDANGEGEGGNISWNRLLKSLIYYRAKRFKESLGFVANAESTPYWIKGDAHVVRALCQHALGNAGEAQAELQKADAWGTEHFKLAGTSAPWVSTYANYNGTFEKIGFVVLSREAHRLIAADEPPCDRELAELAAAVRVFLQSTGQLTGAFDRAILVEPDQTQHWLGRYRARAAAGQTEQAERELEQLVLAAPMKPDGWKIRGRLYAELGKHAETAEAFAKALALTPNSDNWSAGPHRKLCAEIAQWPEVFDRVVKLLPDDQILWLGRAYWHSQHGRWKEAAADMSKLNDSDLMYDETGAYAGLKLLQGRQQEYREITRGFIERIGGFNTSNKWVGLHLAKTCTLSASLPAEQSQVVAWAETGATGEKNQGLDQFVLGLAYYRAGEWERALPPLEEAARTWVHGRHPAEVQQVELVRVMCEFRLDRTDQARQRFKTACDAIDQAVPYTRDNPFAIWPANWISLCILRREAETLILKPERAAESKTK